MRTLKAGTIYFLLVFAVGWVLGPIRELWLVPHLGRTTGSLFEAPLMVNGESVRATPSVGVAIFPDHGENHDAIYKAADLPAHPLAASKPPSGAVSPS